MVDFSKAINNGDMVSGLNNLVQLNVDMASYCTRDLPDLLENKNNLNQVQAFKTLHERHAQMLADTVRMLGGAPAYSESRNRWLGKARIWFGKLRHDPGVFKAMQEEEETLQLHYQHIRAALKASPESVTVINLVVQELDAQLPWLDSATKRS